MFESKIKEDFGITGKEAIERRIILPGHTINYRTGKLIRDGWEMTRTGNRYPTQYEAVKAHFDLIRQEDAEAAEKWANADLQWTVHIIEGNIRHILIERKSGEVLFYTGNRSKITDYFDAHQELTWAKEVIRKDRAAS